MIVGGGIVGCSTAYQLARLGERDLLLLEQGQLTCGTTWHAAGLVGQMRPNRNMARMSRYGIGLYAKLEAETGLATGWKQCGSVNVAATERRLGHRRASLPRRAAAAGRALDCPASRTAFRGEAIGRERWEAMCIWMTGGATP